MSSCFTDMKHKGESFPRQMEKKPIKVTQPQQFERLIALLQEQPALAGVKALSIGFPKKIHYQKWESIAVELNRFGPPTRTAKEWQRVWIHYKSKLKRKLTKQTIESGSIDHLNLSRMEESVKGFVDLQNAIYPTGQSSKTSLFEIASNEVQNAENVPPIEHDAVEYDVAPMSTPSETMSDVKFHSKTVDKESISYLNKDNDILKEILGTLRKIEKVMSKNYDLNKQVSEFKKKRSLEASELHGLKKQLINRKIAWLDIQLRNAK